MSVPAFESKAPADLRLCRKDLLACFGLVLAVAAVFGGLYHADFINLDDFDYVKYNVHLAQGFTWANLKWAFTPGYASNWHPLTWMLHILDYKLFGLNPAGHHLMNVGFHAANAVVLFLLLRSLTRRFWECLLVAALFAIHPLRVESVAWVAERKDVLSTLLILLCIASYARYARARSSEPGQGTGSYALSLVFFALALMAKPMAVTVPFLLLLLDFWPLSRWSASQEQGGLFKQPLRLVVEKAPFFVLTVIACALTLKAQTHAMISLDVEPLSARFGNAIIAYVTYIRKAIWPTDLAVIYPLAWPDVRIVVVSALTLLAISIAALCQWRRRPWMLVGWLWFVGMLVPTIGIVQVGNQRLADRYTYLPIVGLLVAVVFWLSDLLPTKLLRRYAWSAGLIVATCFAYCSHDVCRYWRNSLTLFDYGLTQTSPNWALYYGLGGIIDNLQIPNMSAQAERCFKRALALDAQNPELCRNYGNFFARRGKYAEALIYYDKALAIRPDDAPSLLQKGNVLAILGRWQDAEDVFLEVLASDPGNVIAEVNVAGLYAIERQFDKAVPRYEHVLQLLPTYADAQHFFGVTLAQMGRMGEAVVHFRLAIKYSAISDPAVLNDLAWLLAAVQTPSVHNPAEAIQIAEQACKLTDYSDIAMLDTLAVSYAEAGRFADASSMADKTIAIARTKDRPELLTEMERRKKLYLSQTSYRPASLTEDRPVKSMMDLTPRQ